MATTMLKRPKTLNEFQAMNEHIYGLKNKELYSDEALVRRLLEETARLLEVARKDYRDLFPLYLADIFSWYNAVANRLNLDVQEVMWQKYPGICSYCLRSRDCVCGIEHPPEPSAKTKRLHSLRLDRETREPQTLKDHQLLHASLYSWQHKRELPILIASHIVEEAGELSESLRHADMNSAAEEMADVLSWIFALATRLDLNLSEIMWEIYPYICRKCEQKRCACEEMI